MNGERKNHKQLTSIFHFINDDKDLKVLLQFIHLWSNAAKSTMENWKCDKIFGSILLTTHTMEYLQELFCPTRGTRVRKMINHRPLFLATDYACMHNVKMQKS